MRDILVTIVNLQEEKQKLNKATTSSLRCVRAVPQVPAGAWSPWVCWLMSLSVCLTVSDEGQHGENCGTSGRSRKNRSSGRPVDILTSELHRCDSCELLHLLFLIPSIFYCVFSLYYCIVCIVRSDDRISRVWVSLFSGLVRTPSPEKLLYIHRARYQSAPASSWRLLVVYRLTCLVSWIQRHPKQGQKIPRWSLPGAPKKDTHAHTEPTLSKPRTQ